MDGTGHILFLLSQAEIASSLLKHMPAGELITLARTNSAIRADLHDFGEPHIHKATRNQGVRRELQIGHHDTARWKRLKANAPYECSSSTHTRGTDVKPCRYCSRLICGACMTRDSFANPGEKTFQNRCRSLCESCWTTGNRHQRQKLTDDCECHYDAETGKSDSLQDIVEVTKTCECTNKKDGWVCLECKHLQNKVWFSDTCFGQGCSNTLDSVAERRKICMWCDKPLPITATRENPHIYKQKVIDAMAQEAASRQANVEAHALTRQKRLRMTRRELRGDEAVVGNIAADVPDLVRHLDTVNYALLVGYLRSPTSEQVYNSKLGKWQYNREFLLQFRSRCLPVHVSPGVKAATRNEWRTGERTNQELFDEVKEQLRAEKKRTLSTTTSDDHRGQIIRMRYLERRSTKYIRNKMFEEHGLNESDNHYRRIFAKWKQETELEHSGPGIPNQDRSRYWQDVGSSAADAQENVDTIPSRRMDRSDARPKTPERDGDSSPQSSNHAFAPRSTDAGDIDANTSASGGGKGNQPTDPNTKDGSSADENGIKVDEENKTTATRGISQIIQDLEARRSALESMDSSNPEGTEQLLAEQAALQLEWEEAFAVEGNVATNQNAAVDDSDDVNMLIAIHESLNEVTNVAQNESLPDGRPPIYFA